MNKRILNSELEAVIAKINIGEISDSRKLVLQALIHYIQNKVDVKSDIRLNFICTHNSRRSHLSQIWAQTMAAYCNVDNVFCYSGGTEATALFPKIAETLEENGFQINTISGGINPVYSIKFSGSTHPIIGFSKVFDNDFNPKSGYAAIMTCSHANENCPFVSGAEKRIPITYEDPKISDNTPEQAAVYMERSLQIATEMYHIFSQIK